MKLENTKKNFRRKYILLAMNQLSLNGNAYCFENEVFDQCKVNQKSLSLNTFKADLSHLMKVGEVTREGQRLYLSAIHRYESQAAEALANILKDKPLPLIELPETIAVGDMTLTPSQREAVGMGLSNRLSMVLGGAGCGKTTLIRAVVQNLSHTGGRGWLLVAPTGKAARNLQERTGLEARTVHSALGVGPDEDFLAKVEWPYVDLVVVDEASMATLGMLAGILSRVSSHAKVVLVGDPQQLQSVGAGNILPDLRALGMPHTILSQVHRQKDSDAALLHNVMNFPTLERMTQLSFDDSFQFKEWDEVSAKQALVIEASRRYATGESMQVLASTNNLVYDLNKAIQRVLNPPSPDKKQVTYRGVTFVDGDRVLITKNNRKPRYYNGDVGTLHIYSEPDEEPEFSVELPDGRHPYWWGTGLEEIALAYVLTVHKSQGSEYDSILMPLMNNQSRMLRRNFIYTAISRAKKQVILYGERNALDVAMQTPPDERRTKLVARTNMLRFNSGGVA